MTNLKEINLENFDAVINMKTAAGQEGLVADNVESLAQAYVQPDCYPLAIYAGETPVGFIMYCLDYDDNEYWLYRFMIDEKHQGKGYGRSALTQVLDIVKNKCGAKRIYLGVEKRGKAAPALYESLGFKYDGRILGGEHIMVLEF